MESRRLPRLLFLLAVLPVLAIAPTAQAGENLVANPFFNGGGDDPVPGWTAQRIAGKTTFRLESGVMVAERKSGATTSADSLTQTILLPESTKALRVAVRAAPARIGSAEVVLRFIRIDGRPGGRKTLFRLSGDHALRDFEKDLLLPEGTHNAEIAIRVLTPGRLLVDSASVSVITPEEIRAEARYVRARGSFAVRTSGSEQVESTRFTIPIPPPTATQGPVSLTLRSEPDGRIRSAQIRREGGLEQVDLVVGPLEPGYRVRLKWTATLFLIDRGDGSELPEKLPIKPSRHLPRKVSVLAAPPGDEETLGFAKRALNDSTDLLEVAARIARAVDLRSERDPLAQARLGAGAFRVADVPARPALLIPVDGTGLFPAALAFHPDHDWLRFGLDPTAPRPLPASRAVLLLPEHSDALEWGEFDAVEIGNLTLPEGAGPELIAALRKTWDKASRKYDEDRGIAIDASRLSLRGNAKKLKAAVAELIGE